MAKGCGIGHKNTKHVGGGTDKYMSRNIIQISTVINP
jgi:hypothetical protein